MVPIIIRPVMLEDIPAAYAAARESAAEVSPWIPGIHARMTLADTTGWAAESVRAWVEGSGFSFAIIDPSDGAFLGGCGLSALHPTNRLANLYYWVRTSRTRQGIASQAARLVAQFGIRNLGLLRVEIVVATPNLASQRAAQKAGAQREGLLRNRITINDHTYDAWIFSIIPSDLDTTIAG